MLQNVHASYLMLCYLGSIFYLLVFRGNIILGGGASASARALMFRSNNIVARIFERQIRTPPPGTSVPSSYSFF